MLASRVNTETYVGSFPTWTLVSLSEPQWSVTSCGSLVLTMTLTSATGSLVSCHVPALWSKDQDRICFGEFLRVIPPPGSLPDCLGIGSLLSPDRAVPGLGLPLRASQG